MTRRRGRGHPGDKPDGLGVDRNGRLAERLRLGGQEVIVHYDDIPAKDITTVDGIPCTTALRTVIDLATDLDAARFERVVRDCLERDLFTVDEAKARVAEHDLAAHPGADRLRRLLSRVTG
jgi:hypothetical protein